MKEMKISKITLNKLKKAIKEADWDIICEVYTKISGESIEAPIFSVIPVNDVDLVSNKPSKTIVESRFRTSKGRPSTEFIDLTTEKKDPKALYKNHRRINRNETGAANTGQLIHVRCSECGREENVSAGLAIGYSRNEDENLYKCDKCSRGRSK